MNDDTREPPARDADPTAPHDTSNLPDHDPIARMLIGSFPPVDPDPAVWANIEAEINADSSIPTSRPRPWWPTMMAVAAVLVVVAGAASVFANSNGAEIIATYELTDPDTGKVTMTVESFNDGTSVVNATDLPNLPITQTYQLWSVVNDEVVSVAVLGNELDSLPIRIEGDPAVLALSVEARGGVAVSEQAPAAVWVRS